MTDTARRTSEDVTTEVTAWLEENWNPDLSVGDWWELLGYSGWAVPTWPEDSFGKGMSRGDGVRVSQAITDFGALGPPGGLGLLLHGGEVSLRSAPGEGSAFRFELPREPVSLC